MADSQQELVYRMRTCAAALAAGEMALLQRDAVDLLLEASNRLDIPEPLGELMEALAITEPPPRPSIAQWGGGKLPSSAQPCPSCGLVSARRVDRRERRLFLTCPCTHQWEFGT